MANSYIFADEAGDFTFKRKDGASKFFILCTVTSSNWTISDKLLAVRRELALAGDTERDKLHCTSDLQEVRNVVFEALRAEDFRIDATILQKTKAMPKIRSTEHRFYQYAWYYHFKHVGPKLAENCEKMLITAAALGHKRTRASFKASVNDAAQQVLTRDRWEVAFHESYKDPLLWAADYCAWAIQKKWERGDTRSYDLIAQKVATEYDLFAPGRTEYY